MEIGNLAQLSQVGMTLLNTVVVAIIAWLVNKKWASNVEFKKQAAVMCQIPRRIMWRVGMGMNEQCISDSMLDIHINEMRTAIDEEMPYGAKDFSFLELFNEVHPLNLFTGTYGPDGCIPDKTWVQWMIDVLNNQAETDFKSLTEVLKK